MIELAKHMFRICFIGTFYLACNIFAYFHFLFCRKPLSVEFIKPLTGSNQKKFLCLFVVYSSKLEKNHLRALQGLYSAGYEVIIVANKTMVITPDEQRKLFGFFYNHNVGRDIGGYCRSMVYVYKNKLLDHFEKILFLNDSVIFLNNCGNRFSDFANCDHDYAGIASITIHKYHVPSWCFQLSRSCLLESVVMKFFTTFLPINSRRYLITAGEIELTQTITKLGYSPITFDDPLSLIHYTSLNAYFFPKVVFVKLAFSLFNTTITTDKTTHDFTNIPINFSKFVISSNPTELMELAFSLGSFDHLINRVHLLNLNAVLYNSFPFIKKDLYGRGVYSLATLTAFNEELRKSGEIEIANEVSSDIIGRQSVYDMPLFKRRLFLYGII